MKRGHKREKRVREKRWREKERKGSFRKGLLMAFEYDVGLNCTQTKILCKIKQNDEG